jgi:hypothetical protein
MANFLEAFLDGATGAGLFGKLRWPGAPTELIDSRSVEEFLASGDFERSMESFGYHREEGAPVPAPASARPTIRIIGMDGTLGVLSPDGESVKWYVNGVEVSGTEVLQQQPGPDVDCRILRVGRQRVPGAFSMAAEHMHEHAGGR